MDTIKDYLSNFYGQFSQITKNFFRIRLAKSLIFSKEEMFHIPFDLRGKVATQRYSITGLPCLYLGSSVYICWEELGRPNFNEVQIARFELLPNANILDLGMSPLCLGQAIEKNFDRYCQMDKEDLIDQIASYLICWPLIAACSIRVQDRSMPFKPEYIIPQLLLQWVSIHEDYDGIKYFSVSVDKCNIKNHLLYQNLVFPVKSTESEGHCNKLKNLFYITDTISWQTANIHIKSNNNIFNLKDNPNSVNKAALIELIKDKEIYYGLTEFHDLEELLLDMKASAF